MKQVTVFLAILCLCFYFSSKAQEVVQYDFATKTFAGPAKIKEGAMVVVQYKGVNKYALKSGASITSGSRSYDDGLAQLQSALQQLAGEQDNAEDEKGQTDKALAAPAPGRSIAEKNALTALQTYLEVKAGKLAAINREFNNIREEVLKINSIMSMDKDITAATNDPTLNSQALIDGTIFMQANATGVAAPADFVAVSTGSVSNIQVSLDAIAGLITDLKQNLATAKLTAAQLKEERADLEKLTADVTKRADAIAIIYSGQNLKTLLDNAADMGRRSLKLLNQDFTIDPTVITKADGDYVEIKDKLIDNQGRETFVITPFRINTYGGSRVDFSVGVSVNIGGHGKYKYDLRKNPTNATSGTAMDSVILLSDDEDRLFKFSSAIFVHWYINAKNSKLQWMLTTGVTPNFADLVDSRLSIGTSLGFPSSNNVTRRLILSAGMSWGYADVLKTKYKGLSDYRQFGELDAVDLTERSLKVGAFFSISYNLGGIGH